MNRDLFRSTARKAAAALVGAGLALMGATTALATTSPTAEYRVTVAPSSVQAGSGSFTLTFTDCGIVAGIPACSGLSPSFDTLHRATITLTDAPASATVTLAGWTAGVSGNVVTLTSGGASSDLSFGQSVSVTIPSPKVAGTDSATTAAFDPAGLQFNEMGGDPSVQVGPGPPANIVYTQQPTEVTVNTPISPAVALHVTDAFGNPVPGASVSMAIGADSAGGHLSPPPAPENTDQNGNVSFADLVIDTAGFDYTLRATSGSATATSTSFTVASSQTTCGTTCSGTATDAAGTTTLSASVTGESPGSQLFITMYNPATYPPPSSCSITAEGSGGKVDLNGNTAVTTTNRTLTLRIDKSIVQAAGPNDGVTRWEVCMGAVNQVNPSQPWTTAGGTPAQFDQSTGRFWGILPACGSVAAGSQPCVSTQTKNGAGDILIQISVPAPWDESLIGGLPKV